MVFTALNFFRHTCCHYFVTEMNLRIFINRSTGQISNWYYVYYLYPKIRTIYKTKVDKSKSSTKSANTKSFVITVYLKTGTITTQGNYFQYLSDHEFPSLQSYVNNCAEKFEANTETNNESPKIQSENDASCDKTKQF
jgi:hypothetical protein